MINKNPEYWPSGCLNFSICLDCRNLYIPHSHGAVQQNHSLQQLYRSSRGSEPC